MGARVGFPVRGRLVWGTVIAALILASACSEDRTRSQSPTAPSMSSSRVSGTLVRPASGPGTAEEPLAGVTVTLSPGGRTTRTDRAGGFTFEGVPPGAVTLQFEGTGVHASTALSVAAGTALRVRVEAERNTATLQPRSDGQGQIEGVVLSVDAVGGTLSVSDERLGMVTVKTDSHTIVRRGGTPVHLADIAMGTRVHVKAVKQSDGSLLATEIAVQDVGDRGREAHGTIASIDPASLSFMLQPGNVKVTTDASTVFHDERRMITFADLTVGERVEVQGAAQTDGSILARRVDVEEDAHAPTATPTPGGPTATPGTPSPTRTPKPKETEARGSIQGLDATGHTFMLMTSSGMVTVATDASTKFEGDHDSSGGFADLKLGERVEVEGVLQMDGSILAREVKAED